MWTKKAKYSLCICLLFIALSWAEDMKGNTRKKDNDADFNHGKQRLFARRRMPIGKGNHVPKLKAGHAVPMRRCGRLMESCSALLPCCEPCSSCRCRLFNTICHCWRMSAPCSRRA